MQPRSKQLCSQASEGPAAKVPPGHPLQPRGQGQLYYIARWSVY